MRTVARASVVISRHGCTSHASSSSSDRTSVHNHGVAVAANADLDERISRAVETAVAERRADLEQLVRSRIDLALQKLADELVTAELANGKHEQPAGTKLCAQCGREPRLPQRTVCRSCHRVRARETHAARVTRTAASSDSDEEPAPAPSCKTVRANGARLQTGGLGAPQTPREHPAQVNGYRDPDHAAATVRPDIVRGISAEELHRRSSRGFSNKYSVSAAALERWLVRGAFAERTEAGLLVPTRQAVVIGESIWLD